MSEAIKAIIGDELYSQVTSKLGDKKIDLLDGYIPKARFDEVNTTKNTLKTQIGELTNQMETLKTSVKGNDVLEKTIGELQAKNTNWEQKYQKSLITSEIKLMAHAEKAKDPNDIIPFIDSTGLQIDDSGKVKGLSPLFTELKKNKPYLFDIEASNKQKPGINPAGTGNTNDNMKNDMRKAFGL